MDYNVAMTFIFNNNNNMWNRYVFSLNWKSEWVTDDESDENEKDKLRSERKGKAENGWYG